MVSWKWQDVLEFLWGESKRQTELLAQILRSLEAKPTPSSGEETESSPPEWPMSGERHEEMHRQILAQLGRAERTAELVRLRWEHAHLSPVEEMQELDRRLAALEPGPKRVRYPLTEQGIKGAMASIESSADEKTPSCPMTLTEWQDWVDQMQTDVLVLKQKVAALEAGPRSPPITAPSMTPTQEAPSDAEPCQGWAPSTEVAQGIVQEPGSPSESTVPVTPSSSLPMRQRFLHKVPSSSRSVSKLCTAWPSSL